MKMVHPLRNLPSLGLGRLASPPAIAATAGVLALVWLALTIGDEIPLLPVIVATAAWSTSAALFFSSSRADAAPLSGPPPAFDLPAADDERDASQVSVVELPSLFDAPSGLASAATLKEAMRIEIARSSRYGNPLALALFDLQVVTAGDARHAPSPVQFIADTFRRCVRESDVVARLDRSHFAVLLTESGATGCQGFVERLRSALSSAPYAERDGTRFYVQSRAGWTTSLQGHSNVSDYARGALADLNSRYVQQGS